MPAPFRKPDKRPMARYVALVLLASAALVYQVRYTMYRFPGWFGKGNAAGTPFLIVPDGAGHLATYLIQPVPGMRNGQPVLAIDGQPLKGTAVFGQAVKHHRPGDLMSVTLADETASGASGQRVIWVRVPTGTPLFWLPHALAVLLLAILPAFCLALGFSVAFIRVHDRRAWLLLTLMLSFAGFFNPGAETWEPVLRDYGAAYSQLMTGCLPISLLLFGLYFPEPFPANSRWAHWSWLKWFFIVPLALSATGDAITAAGAIENYAAVQFVARIFRPFSRILQWMYYSAGPIFILSLAIKFHSARSRDARRRLRLLFVGAIFGVGPVAGVRIVALLLGVNAEQNFPNWLSAAAYLMFFLFPLTLAYVIVVQRAMDVRVVIRQGLKYVLARRGILVVRVVIAVVLWTVVSSWVNRIGGRSLAGYLILAGAVMLWLSIRRLLEAVSTWTDRHFFREAYNAEQLLAELGVTVRSILETRPLLATVAERISESLHVPRIAVLLNGSGPYEPAYALGYERVPSVAFTQNAATIRQLRKEGEPARIYFDDPNSWVYTDASEEERHRLAQLQPELLLPLSAKDKLFGFISLGQKLSEEPYTPSDVRLLQSVAAQTGLALEVARLTTAIGEEIAQRERLNREVEIAREVQERLFPQDFPPVPGLDYCGACRPALGVGGDYYDFLVLPGQRLGIALGDVSGKGIAAALMMASLQASLRAEAARGADDLASIIAKVNRLLFDATTANRYATFFYAQYDAAGKRLTYVNAGHNSPLLFRASGEIRRLETGGMVLGLLKDAAYSQESIPLDAGDLLVAYTDGITETMNAAEEEWGEEKLIETVRQYRTLSARETIARIMEAADAFAAGAKQHDDMTIDVVRVIGA